MPPFPPHVRMSGAALQAPMTLYDAAGNSVLIISDQGETTIGIAGNPVIVVSRLTPTTPALTLGTTIGRVGFFGATPSARPTVSPPSLPHLIAALQTLGLIA